ncbi:MAG: ABC transporter ATP-binding protein [Chloroflexi bacterium]|nr:ABC transporter ATP-binding protein [Chloroflexota bacterium]
MTTTPKRAAIETWGLRKEYGATVAVADLTLRVGAGEVFGFLGPNGAGKTTSLKMLLGLVHPTAGEGSLLGRPLGTPAARKQVGFLPEHFRFPHWLTAREFLDLHGRLLDLTVPVRREQIKRLLDLVELAAAADRRLGTFSKGMMQRIGLAQALLGDPLLVFLDEPTSGLDPFGRRLVRQIINDLRDRGVTVFLNSHLLSEVEATCDRVGFIRDGEIVDVVPLHTLLAGHTEVELRLGRVDDALLAGLRRWGEPLRVDDHRVTLQVRGEDALPRVAAWLVAQQADLYAMTPRQYTLEDLFLRIVEKPEVGR